MKSGSVQALTAGSVVIRSHCRRLLLSEILDPRFRDLVPSFDDRYGVTKPLMGYALPMLATKSGHLSMSDPLSHLLTRQMH